MPVPLTTLELVEIDEVLAVEPGELPGVEVVVVVNVLSWSLVLVVTVLVVVLVDVLVLKTAVVVPVTTSPVDL